MRQWKKWLTVFCETSTHHSRETTWNSSMKEIYKSWLLRSLQQWYNKATLLYRQFLLLYHSDALNQSNVWNFSAYIIKCVIGISTLLACHVFHNCISTASICLCLSVCLSILSVLKVTVTLKSLHDKLEVIAWQNKALVFWVPKAFIHYDQPTHGPSNWHP